MAVKVENHASVPVNEIEAEVQRALECVPVEHLRGFSRVVFVDKIQNARLEKSVAESLPLLYHPRQPGTTSAFGEIALAVLLPSEASWWKRRVAKANLKSQVVQCVLALAGQHYFVTISSRKKTGGGVERALREYVEKYFKIWRDRQAGLRARIFRPLVPYIEKLQRSARKAQAEQARRKAAN